MKHRSPLAVVALTIVTLGFYGLYWEVSTKNEMVKMGADIPTAWLLIVPFINFYWIWKYAGGVEKVTNGKQSQMLVFILLVLLSLISLSLIAMAIIQSEFNKVGSAGSMPMPAGDAWTPPAQPAAAPLASTAFVPPAAVAPVAPEAWAPPAPAAAPAPAVAQPQAFTPPAPVDPTQPQPPQTPPQV